jgi:hypothetical protein
MGTGIACAHNSPVTFDKLCGFPRIRYFQAGLLRGQVLGVRRWSSAWYHSGWVIFRGR